MEEKKKFCTNCGKELDEDSKFCKNCGSELDEGSVFCDECGTRVGQSNPQRSAGNNVFRKYNIDMLAGEEIIKHSVMHSGCLIPPLLVFCFGIFLGFVLISDSYFYYPIFMIFCFLNILS